jgi:hypothetical protein
LQDTIAIDVNFIVVRTTDNRGSTQGHAKAQIDFLNLTFLPDFKFNLKNNKVVVNDDYFTKVKNTPAVESEMKKAHRIGGMETLNVYAVEMDSGIVGGFTFPFTNGGDNDGIVLNYQAVPRGGHAYYSEGDVSIEHEGLLPVVVMFQEYLIFVQFTSLVRDSYIWLGIGSASSIRLKVAAQLQMTASTTRRQSKKDFSIVTTPSVIPVPLFLDLTLCTTT